MPWRHPYWSGLVLGAAVLTILAGSLTSITAIWIDPTRGELLAAVIGTTTVQVVVALLTLLRVERHTQVCERAIAELRLEKEEVRRAAK